MPQKILRSPKALRDLEEHVDYIKHDSVLVAERFLDAVEETIRFLSVNSQVGQLCPFLDPDAAGLRMWPVDGFRNHVVFYRAAENGIEVSRVSMEHSISRRYLARATSSKIRDTRGSVVRNCLLRYAHTVEVLDVRPLTTYRRSLPPPCASPTSSLG